MGGLCPPAAPWSLGFTDSFFLRTCSPLGPGLHLSEDVLSWLHVHTHGSLKLAAHPQSELAERAGTKLPTNTTWLKRGENIKCNLSRIQLLMYPVGKDFLTEFLQMQQKVVSLHKEFNILQKHT